MLLETQAHINMENGGGGQERGARIIFIPFVLFFVPWKPELGLTQLEFDSEINTSNIISTFPLPNPNKSFAPGYFWNVQ